MSNLHAPEYSTENLPYKVAVLCYLWDRQGRVLMLHRRKNPNPDMFSPIGGKLEISQGEGPHECAVREIREEAGVTVAEKDLRCFGVVSERAYQGEMHWLIFLFELIVPMDASRVSMEEIDEGRLEWVPLDHVESKNIPWTDREIMWPAVRKHRGGGYFMVHIDCSVKPPVHRMTESRLPQREAS